MKHGRESAKGTGERAAKFAHDHRLSIRRAAARFGCSISVVYVASVKLYGPAAERKR